MAGDYLDFDLRIWREGTSYLAQVIASPAGSSGAHETLPFPADLARPDLAVLLENAVLRGKGGLRAPTSESERELKLFGQSLFDAVLRQPREVSSLLERSLAAVAQRDKVAGLRLKLRITPPELARLPWEYLNDARHDNWLALRVQSPVVRFLDVESFGQEALGDGPLRILGMIANPRGWEQLDVERERRRIEGAVKPLVEDGRVDLRWVPGQGSKHLRAMMREGPWHVFHFIGHGIAPSDADEEGDLVFADDAGEAHRVPASKLKYFLSGPELQGAVLNCCDSGRGQGSPGPGLVRAGANWAVAMQMPIGDDSASAFAEAFYSNIVAGITIEEAVTQGRLDIFDRSDLEWAIPVLYTRVASQALVARPARKAPERPAEPSEEVASARQALRDLFAESEE